MRPIERPQFVRCEARYPAPQSMGELCATFWKPFANRLTSLPREAGCRRIRRDQLRMFTFNLLQLTNQRVILGIRDLRAYRGRNTGGS